MFLVIGSGPSGVACAAALIEAGYCVTMIDGGQALEGEREARRRRMAAADPADWTPDDCAAARTSVTRSGDVDCKLTQGSDYPYRPGVGAAAPEAGGLKLRGSYARGGLSAVWGAALMPFAQRDLVGWPITVEELTAAQAAVLRLLPFAARSDDLATAFPLHAAPGAMGRHSSQIQRFLAAAGRNRTRLNAEGLSCGASRLAVEFGGSGEGACTYCGHCLHGCPRDLIYSAAQSLPPLLKSGRLTYRPGVIVKTIAEDAERVIARGIDANGAPVELIAERLFLGAGVLNSAEIMLRSTGRYEAPVEILDSQYFLFPLVQFFASANVAAEPLHTLAQAYVEILDATVSPYTVHLQIYSYNDLLRDLLHRKLGALKAIFPENALLGRFLLAQGYLHSAHSGRIEAHLARAGDRLVLRGRAAADAPTRIRRVLGKFAKTTFSLHAAPLAPLLQITEPGRGFHIGGSFPMAAQPAPGQTDRLGRPFGWTRAHVIDASLLPSIPATTITQTVMANAFRIGCEASRHIGVSS